MKRKKILLFIFFPVLAFAQINNDPCNMDFYTDKRKMIDANYANFLNNLYSSLPLNVTSRNSLSTYTIPVVFHVLSDSTSIFVSDSSIIAQLEALNIAFAHTNADSVDIPSAWFPFVGRSQIQFCLADKDTMGNSFNGIIRKTTNHGVFQYPWDVYDPSIGGDPMWDTSKYYNVYVCRLPAGEGGVATLATQPACVIPSAVNGFGFGLNGYALVHEVGHTFWLKHPWGVNGFGCNQTGDYITDTPPEGGPISGCPTYPYYDSCTTSGIGINVNNYMDYSSCKRMFTQGQVSWMENYVLSHYASLLISNTCSQITSTEAISGNDYFKIFPNPVHDVLHIEQKNSGQIKSIYISDVLKHQIEIEHMNTNHQYDINISSLPAGIYFLEIITDSYKATKLFVKE